MEIVQFAIGTGVAIDEGEVGALKFSEESVPSDFSDADAGFPESEQQRPRVLITLECRRTRASALRPRDDDLMIDGNVQRYCVGHDTTSTFERNSGVRVRTIAVVGVDDRQFSVLPGEFAGPLAGSARVPVCETTTLSETGFSPSLSSLFDSAGRQDIVLPFLHATPTLAG